MRVTIKQILALDTYTTLMEECWEAHEVKLEGMTGPQEWINIVSQAVGVGSIASYNLQFDKLYRLQMRAGVG